MKTVGAYEAKSHFAQLLDQAANGETITITRHGNVIARLVPAEPPIRPDLKELMEDWEAYRERHNITLSDLSIREMIEEGRM